MTLSTVLDSIALFAAFCTAVYTIVIMIKWPPGRDPRPMAPLLALAVAFIALKLRPYFGAEVRYEALWDYAWSGWYTVTFVELVLLIRLFGRQRNGCGVGACCAVKRGAK